MPNTKIYSIDGNIGSGKSTLVSNLANHLKNNKKVCFLQEPVNIWTNILDENNVNIIENYYKDQEKFAFPFQMMAYISRLAILRDALKKDYDVIITERSVYTDKMVFAKMLYDDKKIDKISYTIYNQWFEEFLKDIPTINTIYVKTSPEIAHERVTKRARKGETIPLEYLENCHEYHEEWLKNINKDSIKIIDGNVNIYDNPKIVDMWINDITYYMFE